MSANDDMATPVHLCVSSADASEALQRDACTAGCSMHQRQAALELCYRG